MTTRRASDTTTMRRRLGASYCSPGQYGGDLTAFASTSNYFKKGEQFILGVDVLECTARHKVDFDRWSFECTQVRRLTKDEFVERNWPKAVPGTNWPKKST